VQRWRMSEAVLLLPSYAFMACTGSTSYTVLCV
jgi:hypothetical protein